MCEHSSEVIYKDLDFMGREGYQVGSDGSIWTCRSRVCIGRHKGSKAILTDKWSPMKLGNVKGYRTVELGASLDGSNKPCNFRVHRLVLLAFVGPPPEGTEACHDPDPTRSNNRLENLRWATHIENQKDMVKSGRSAVGERNSGAKITREVAEGILKAWQERKKNKRGIGRMFGVSEHVAGRIIRGQNWKHLSGEICPVQ
jgi:HNH endonuclease